MSQVAWGRKKSAPASLLHTILWIYVMAIGGAVVLGSTILNNKTLRKQQRIFVDAKYDFILVFVVFVPAAPASAKS